MSKYSYVSVIEPMDGSGTIRLSVETEHRLSPGALVTVDGFPHPFSVVVCSMMDEDDAAVVTALAPFEKVTGIYSCIWKPEEPAEDQTPAEDPHV